MNEATDRLLRNAAAGLFAIAVFVTARPAQAMPKILEPNTHPWFVTGGVGVSHSFNACSVNGCNSFGFQMFKFSPEFGYHFSGNFEGPALGAGFDVSAGGTFGVSVVRFEPGVKFWWDIPIIDDLGVTVAPFGKAGYGLYRSDFLGFTATSHFAHFQIGAAGRLSLANRAVVFIQPITFNMLANGDGTAFAYDILVGGGVTWGN